MSTAELLYSVAFYLAFVVYLLFGAYIISLNSKLILHRVFFMLCLVLCLWAFTFSIANSAPDYATALFWRRVSAFGWGTMYSLLLHFILILTGKEKLLRQAWTYLWLYLPAAATVYVFALHPGLVSQQYNLMQTAVGWINVSANNRWDWYFNLYYLIFTVAGVGLIWQWGRQS